MKGRKLLKGFTLVVYLLMLCKVLIRGKKQDLLFENVSVEPFNLRTDTFQKDVITAIDILLSLEKAGKLKGALGCRMQISGKTKHSET